MKLSPTFTLISMTAALAGATDIPDSAPLRVLDPILISTVPARTPLETELDAKAPVQPLPAHDGADLLRSIPGFSVIRKGGADGDPMFRGLGGSRLTILADGQAVLGGCGMRMDPPTAYIFPAAYDRVVITKGPQSVRHGPGSSAAVVRFDRDVRRAEEASFTALASATGGSYGRNDQMLELRQAAPVGRMTASATRSGSDDFRDGSGNRVHSSYERWSLNGAAAWTPSDGSFVEVSGALSDGEAAYADRAMDGVKFARESVSLRARHEREHGVLRAVEAQAYHSYIDHVMDNYTLRTFTPTMMMRYPSVSNPDRQTQGGRAECELAPALALSVVAGIDAQHNRHRVRSTSNQTTQPYGTKPRVKDAAFAQRGAFAEIEWEVSPATRMLGGARLDDWNARKPTADLERDDLLASAFARYEHKTGSTLWYAGLGRGERFPDYWELVGGQPAKPNAAFFSESEKLMQIDVGVLHRAGPCEVSVSLFANRVDDFLLIQPSSATITRNIDAGMFGGEAAVAVHFSERLRAEATLALARGDNLTDDLPLAQMPPMEARLALGWTGKRFTTGALLRLVAAQNRVAPGQGGIVGQDIGPSGGFATIALNAGYALNRSLRLQVGVDNLLDATFAEHISRGGSAVTGFPTLTRVNEPGRVIWAKLDADF